MERRGDVVLIFVHEAQVTRYPLKIKRQRNKRICKRGKGICKDALQTNVCIYRYAHIQITCVCARACGGTCVCVCARVRVCIHMYMYIENKYKIYL